jgi:hypothetical protein
MTSTCCLAVPLAAIVAAGAAAQTPQHLVVPAAYTTNDAVSFQWIAGASRDVRQQTLIAPNHLTALVGHTLWAIELRRTAANEVYQGGTADLTVHLSTSPNDPLSCAPAFAANIGVDEMLVFDGPVVLPTSPIDIGPAVAWSASNTVRITFTTPFLYLGGTLCVDVIGHPVGGQNADWWMADAMFEDIKGTTTDLGGGCGPYGGAQSQWSHVSKRSLLAGAQARFFAYGTPYTSAALVIGGGSTVGVPMWQLGFASPVNCEVHLNSILGVLPVVFEPDPNPLLAARGGLGDVRLGFANDGTFLGITFATQWLEVAQWQTSNTIEWTTASSVPQLGMALLEGDPSEATGEVSVHLAHVLRFEFL